MGHVGIVLGLEISRLARSSADWHRLLEMCLPCSTNLQNLVFSASFSGRNLRNVQLSQL